MPPAYTVAPLLKSVAASLSGVTLLYGHSLLKFAQGAPGVTATLRKPDGGAMAPRGAYLAGCDGGASPVRRQLSIRLRGEGNLLQLRQAPYRCDEFCGRLPISNGPGHSRHYHVADVPPSVTMPWPRSRCINAGDTPAGRTAQHQQAAPIQRGARDGAGGDDAAGPVRLSTTGWLNCCCR
ncbi:MAG: hypothetical protein JWP20_2382 [Roseomonas sp.]|nr:hypothetical protein [Roseomonas sp.]